METQDGKACISCHVFKPLFDYQPRIKTTSGGKKGEPAAKCKDCMVRDRERTRTRKRQREEDLEIDLAKHKATLSWLEFLGRAQKGVETEKFQIQAYIDTSSLAGAVISMPLNSRAAAIAKEISQHTMFHWTYVKK